MTFIVGNAFNALGRAGTPMLLMLTGALLLNEKREIAPRAFYRSHLLPIVLLLLFWLMFYAGWRAVLIPLIQGGPIDMEVFVDNLLLRKGRGLHLWYLYMLVGAYLVIPVLRLFVKKENREIHPRADHPQRNRAVWRTDSRRADAGYALYGWGFCIQIPHGIHHGLYALSPDRLVPDSLPAEGEDQDCAGAVRPGRADLDRIVRSVPLS